MEQDDAVPPDPPSGSGEPPLPRDIFEELILILGASPEDIPRRIEELCREHSQHADLIRQYERHAEFTRPDPPVDPAPPGQDHPDRVGAYRILEVLGEGGMGTVYLAEQKEPVRRHVALKVIKLGMDSRQVLQRFQAERQALALMNHDGIARAFEAGATERGEPFFAMEYVPGLPITRYCDKQQLSIKERLRLFQQVCSGVQHAHQKGIIHRDLKPSNILVTEHQGGAVAKIIDFGIAKATAMQLTEATMLPTARGFPIGTPEYMSPEQAEMTSADIDTRTDIYSLGIILYEMLVGELPFSPTELRRAGLLEIQRKIREDEPPKPSTKISTSGRRSTDLAKRRKTSVPRLLREVKGDLDWIVMMAIEKDRNRRYPTVAALAEDIGRHLARLPVVAGPPSASYRVGKFVQRYRTQVTAASVVFVALIGGLLASLLFYRDARASAREAEVTNERYEQVAYVVQLDNAKREAGTLIPAWPEQVARIDSWLRDKAEPLRNALPGLRLTLARLETLQDENDHPLTTRQAQEFLRQTLSSLVADLESFVAEGGLVERVTESLSWARNVDRLSIDEHRDAWTRTIEEIRSDPRYGGLELSPQRGLVPLGRDPESQLFEFYHIRSGSGDIPERDGAGRLPGLTEESGIHFVLVPPGAFQMGAQSQREADARFDVAATPIESPVHRVVLDAFFLAKHELTAAQWRRLNGDQLPNLYVPGKSVGVGTRQEILWTNPVESVNWFGFDELLTRHGLCLPTEAQWEYAARAGTDTPWWTGSTRESLRGAVNLNDLTAVKAGIPWPETEEWLEDGFVVHAPVDSLRPNPFGLHHVHGNVWEWCRDTFARYDVPPRPGDGLREGGNEAVRIIRGGGFEDVALLARISGRGFTQPFESGHNLGARPARVIY